ncbi:MAG: hypothetical protein H7318_14245 [Oligoflexus sp.]|nr:hypothetical protein [Oligoflexus sp.]
MSKVNKSKISLLAKHIEFMAKEVYQVNDNHKRGWLNDGSPGKHINIFIQGDEIVSTVQFKDMAGRHPKGWFDSSREPTDMAIIDLTHTDSSKDILNKLQEDMELTDAELALLEVAAAHPLKYIDEHYQELETLLKADEEGDDSFRDTFTQHAPYKPLNPHEPQSPDFSRR